MRIAPMCIGHSETGPKAVRLWRQVGEEVVEAQL